MNIALVLSQKGLTGAEVYAATLADELIRRGHQVVIVSDAFTKTTKAEYLPLTFNNRNFFNRIKHVKFLVRLIKERDIEVLHAHSRASGWVSFFCLENLSYSAGYNGSWQATCAFIKKDHQSIWRLYNCRL